MQSSEDVQSKLVELIDNRIVPTVDNIDIWIGGAEDIQTKISEAINTIEVMETVLLSLLTTAIGVVGIAIGQVSNSRETALGDINTAKEQALAAIAQTRPGPLQTADNPEFQAPHRRADPEIV